MAKATAEVEDLLFNAAGNGNFKKVLNLFKSDKNINLGKQQAKCNINWLFQIDWYNSKKGFTNGTNISCDLSNFLPNPNVKIEPSANSQDTFLKYISKTLFITPDISTLTR